MANVKSRTINYAYGAVSARNKSSRTDYSVPALLFALLMVYLALGAKALNLDGLGYAGRLTSGDPMKWLLPGHLLYTPLMHAVYRLVSIASPGVDAARLMQVCGAVFAAVGVGVFVSALRRLAIGRFASIAAGLALAFSYTYWTHATDLTTYALSTLCLVWVFHILCAARARSKAPNAWSIGSMVALATLIHQSNVVFLPAAMIGVAGVSGARARNVLKVAAVSLGMIFLAYGVLGSAATGSLSPQTVAKWAAGGSHGYAPEFEPVNLIRGVYGFANAVIYLDDAGTLIKGSAAGVSGTQLSAWVIGRLAAKAVLLALVVAVPLAAYARRRRLGPDQRWMATLCVAWIVPYALVALLFFTTDHDRWIMLMPAVAALAATANPRPSFRGKLAGVAIVAVLLILNLTSAVYPAHTGASNRYYQEALRLEPRMAPTDMIIFWGHEHIGTAGYLRLLRPVDAIHVVDLVRDCGKTDGLSELTRRVNAALAAKRRVLVVGLYGSSDAAGDYLSEAHALGLGRSEVERSLAQFAQRRSFSCDGYTAYELRNRR